LKKRQDERLEKNPISDEKAEQIWKIMDRAAEVVEWHKKARNYLYELEVEEENKENEDHYSEESKTKATDTAKNKVTNPTKSKATSLFNENEVEKGKESEWLNPDALPLSDYREIQRLNDGYSLTSLSSALSKESLMNYMANKIANEKVWIKPDWDDNEAWDKLKSKETKPKNKVTRKATKKTSKKSEAKNKVTNKSTKSLDKKGTNDYNTEDKGGPLQTLVSSQKWDESTRTTSFFTTQKNNKWKDVLIRTKNWKEQVIESTAKNKDMFTNEEKFDFKPEWGWYEDLILFMMRYIMEK
jgi:hypothetical protein